LRMLEMGERAIGTREIDQHVGAADARHVIAHLQAADLGADAGHVEQRDEAQLGLGAPRLDERAAHAAAGAANRDFHCPAAEVERGGAASPSKRATLPSSKNIEKPRFSRLPLEVSRE